MTGRRDMLLGDASIQDIQLELIRRRRFNEFDGSKVVDSLLHHRDLWRGAYMDRWGVPHPDQSDWLPCSSLIHLRDLPHNHWNVDTLFVLTASIVEARKLYDLASEEDWRADELIVQDNEREIALAIGRFPCECGLLTAWWD